MCGILGTNFLTSNFDEALKHLNNRGPDFNKKIQLEDKLFGHTRLSIIDFGFIVYEVYDLGNKFLIGVSHTFSSEFPF